MEYANLDAHQKETSRLHEPQRRRKRRKSHWRRFILFILLFVMVFGIYNFSPLLMRMLQLFWASPAIVYSVIANKDPSLKSTNGRTNLLLLGTAGGEHDGPDLSDTIIVASVNIETGDTVLFSLPRDVYIDETKTKVNAVYAYGQKKNQGLEQTKEVLSSYLGLPIHYGVRLDFAGFRKAVDTLGGIDVEVATSFDDYQYPIEGKEHDTCGFVEQMENFSPTPTPSATPRPQRVGNANEPTAIPRPSGSPSAPTGARQRLVYVNTALGKKIYAEEVTPQNNPYSCRYEHIRYTKGITTMDGDTALKFVRSRKGTNGEGSDFARSRRQQTVILAFRQAITSKETIFDVPKIQSLVETFGKSIDTDIPTNELGDFYKLYKKVKSATVRSVALTDGQDDGIPVFVNPPLQDYGGQWVLTPKNNDWSVVKQAILANLQPPSPSPSAPQ